MRSHPRKLRKHSKVRTGCVTCKSRKIRCDETEPACRRCTAYGRPCGGYQPPKTWLFEPNAKPTCSPVLTKAIAPVSAPHRERRAFLFFRERTAAVVAQFSTHSDRFWNEAVPRHCVCEPALWHVMAATAARHQLDICSPECAVPTREFSVKQYSQAVRLLTQPEILSRPEVILMASCLFAACENFQESSAPSSDGLTHILHALRILQQLRVAEGTTLFAKSPNIVTEYLAPMLGQVELVMSIFNTPTTMKIALSASGASIVEKRPTLPSSFQDLCTAQHYFIQIWRWRFHSCIGPGQTDAWTADSPPFLDVLDLLRRWHELLISYHKTIVSKDPDEGVRAMVMVREYRLLHMCFLHSVGTSPEKVGWKKRDQYSRRIIPQTVDLSRPDEVSIDIPLDRQDWQLEIGSDTRLTSVPRTVMPKASLWPVAETIPGLDHDRQQAGTVRMRLASSMKRTAIP